MNYCQLIEVYVSSVTLENLYFHVADNIFSILWYNVFTFLILYFSFLPAATVLFHI